jgi:hypothetical protein
MMLANVPVVLLGDRLAHKIPVRVVHAIATVIFAGLGVATRRWLLDVGRWVFLIHKRTQGTQRNSLFCVLCVLSRPFCKRLHLVNVIY